MKKRQRKTVMYCGKRCRVIDNDQKTFIKIDFNGEHIWRSREAIEGKSK
jgi:hypothetical protein